MKSEFRGKRKRQSVATYDLQKISIRREKGMRIENTQLDKNFEDCNNNEFLPIIVPEGFAVVSYTEANSSEY